MSLRPTWQEQMKSFLLGLVLVVALPAAAKVGESAPDIKVEDARGQAVTLSSLRGKVVVLDFWASFCEPCKEELPRVDALAKKLASRKNVVFVAVNLDKKREKADAFLAVAKLASMTLLFDPKNTSGQRAQLPMLWVLDTSGVVRFERAAVEESTIADLEKAVVELAK
jgi:thiol-disulfide isomerase/thioredoxin